MKVTVEKRLSKDGSRYFLRLVYWYGSYTDADGKTKHNRKRENLEQFLYVAPKNRIEKQHNKDTEALVEAIRAKRVLEDAKGSHGFNTGEAVRFYALFDAMMDEKRTPTGRANLTIWQGCRKQIKLFWPDENMLVSQIDHDALMGLRRFLDTQAVSKTGRPIRKATSNTYFQKVRSVVKRAFDRGYIQTNLLAEVKNIRITDQERVFLTIDEVRQLVATPCRYDVLKRAFLFACLTGLRWSDVNALEWSQFSELNGGFRITFTQKKTKGLQYLDITPQAVALMGPRGEGRVFVGLRYSTNSNIELLRWAMAAGISKHVTFHAARHTFAVSLLCNGVDLYTVSKLLGHSQIKTTQIYADIIDEVRRDAIHCIPDIGV